MQSTLKSAIGRLIAPRRVNVLSEMEHGDIATYLSDLRSTVPP